MLRPVAKAADGIKKRSHSAARTSYMDDQLHEALDLMRRALKLLDTANESTAAPHLDLAIARLEETVEATEPVQPASMARH